MQPKLLGGDVYCHYRDPLSSLVRRLQRGMRRHQTAGNDVDTELGKGIGGDVSELKERDMFSIAWSEAILFRQSITGAHAVLSIVDAVGLSPRATTIPRLWWRIRGRRRRRGRGWLFLLLPPRLASLILVFEPPDDLLCKDGRNRSGGGVQGGRGMRGRWRRRWRGETRKRRRIRYCM